MPPTEPNPPRRQVLHAAVAAGLGSAWLASAAPAVAADEPPAEPKAVPPKAEDVATLDAILGALYGVISGPKGQARDWDRMRSLFLPGARLIPCLPRSKEGPVTTRTLSVEDYVRRAGPALEKGGFFETEIARRAETFGHVTQVFSTYESRTEPGGKPFARGVNSIQLFWDEARWWVVTIFWDAETPATPIPERYLPKT